MLDGPPLAAAWSVTPGSGRGGADELQSTALFVHSSLILARGRLSSPQSLAISQAIGRDPAYSGAILLSAELQPAPGPEVCEWYRGVGRDDDAAAHEAMVDATEDHGGTEQGLGAGDGGFPRHHWGPLSAEGVHVLGEEQVAHGHDRHAQGVVCAQLVPVHQLPAPHGQWGLLSRASRGGEDVRAAR
jgi:hypothetical protein